MKEDHLKHILEKRGGAMPMHLRDAETGKTVYDNRDATAMARRWIERGGPASDFELPKLDYITVKCPCANCKKIDNRFFNQVFHIGFYCYDCNTKNEPIKVEKNALFEGAITIFLRDKESTKLEEFLNLWLSI